MPFGLKNAGATYQHLVTKIFMAAKMLRPYIQCHPISVVTIFPLWNIMNKKELLGRLDKWPVKLNVYDIIYQPRNAIKSQVFVDFVADFSSSILLEAEKEAYVITTQAHGMYSPLKVSAHTDLSFWAMPHRAPKARVPYELVSGLIKLTTFLSHVDTGFT